MRKKLFFDFMNMNNLSFFKNSVFFRIVILIILFLFSFSYAQQQKQDVDNQAAIITLENGAKFYSADDDFNQQVVQGKIIIKNARLAFKKMDDGKVLIASSVTHSSNQNLAQQIKTIEVDKSKEVLRKIKKQIDRYEVESKFFEKQNYQNFPSQFFSSHPYSKNYVAPSYNVNYFSKIYASDKDYSVKRALDFLHTQQFTFYNNKSLNFCFSEVFPVRPPPVVLS